MKPPGALCGRRKAAQGCAAPPLGYTLVELLVVVTLIAVLASVLVPRFADAIRAANEGATKGRLGSLRSALTIYYADTEGSYPADMSPILQPGSRYLTAIFPIYTYEHGNHEHVQLHSAVDKTLDTGALGYVNRPGEWGEVWVQCTHTDLKGNSWSQF